MTRSNSESAGSPTSTVLFDLDGTLVDTTYLHTIAWAQALAESGYPAPMVTLHPLIGMGGEELLGTVLGRDDAGVRSRHDRHFKSYRDKARLLPGAADLLEWLQSEGARVVVVTSSKPDDAEAILDATELTHRIDDLVHGHQVERAKPEPDLFEVALRRSGAQPHDAVAVGDAVWDIQAASSAGVPTIGVATGGTPVERLLEAGALAVYRSCQDVLAQWSRNPFTRR